MGFALLAAPLLLLAAPLDLRTTRAWSNQEVENHLRSVDPLDVAWAAHETAVRPLRHLVPVLLDVLESPPEGEERDLALEHTLDALIQLGAEIEPRHVVNLDLSNRLLRDELLVLMARRPDRFERALLDVVDRRPDRLSFHAAVSLAAKIRSRGLAERLLKPLRTDLLVEVHDPQFRRMGYGFGCGGAIVRMGGAHYSMWPPSFDYVLELDDGEDEEEVDEEEGPAWGPTYPLVSAPYPIVARRRAQTPNRLVPTWEASQSALVVHLTHLAGLPPDSIELPARQTVNVGFESVEQVSRFIEAERTKLLSAHDRLRETLATQGLLDRSKWTATALRLSVEVKDERRDKSVPLGF